MNKKKFFLSKPKSLEKSVGSLISPRIVHLSPSTSLFLLLPPYVSSQPPEAKKVKRKEEKHGQPCSWNQRRFKLAHSLFESMEKLRNSQFPGVRSRRLQSTLAAVFHLEKKINK